MKKIKLNGKLDLNKTTISKLNHDQMRGMRGGRAIESIAPFMCDTLTDGGGNKSKNIACDVSDVLTDGVTIVTKTVETIANC